MSTYRVSASDVAGDLEHDCPTLADAMALADRLECQYPSALVRIDTIDAPGPVDDPAPAHLDHVAEVRATLAMRELEARRHRIVLIETAGRRQTGARRELEAPALMVNGRLATAGTEWLTALESAERDHEAGR